MSSGIPIAHTVRSANARLMMKYSLDFRFVRNIFLQMMTLPVIPTRLMTHMKTSLIARNECLMWSAGTLVVLGKLVGSGLTVVISIML